MEHACRDSGSVHPQRCNNVTVNVTIAVSIRVTFSVDVESVITISERNEFYVNFRFTVTDIR